MGERADNLRLFIGQEDEKRARRSHEDKEERVTERSGDLCLNHGVYNAWQSTLMVERQRTLPPVASPCYQTPCLMSFGFGGNKSKIFDPFLNEFYYVEIPEISDAEIRYCNYGWLLMSRADLSLFFFNPFSRIKIQLPAIPCHFNNMCFSSLPTSKDCLVFGVSFLEDEDVLTIGFLGRGEKSWVSQSYKHPDNKYMLSDSSPIFCKGLFYYLGVAGVVGKYDPKDQTWRILRLLFEPCSGTDPGVGRKYLAEVDGDLVGVFVIDEMGTVRVCRLDFKKMVWQGMDNLGNKKTLYVSRTSSLAETATMGGIEDKIFFPEYHGNNGVFYSVTTRKYQSFTGDIPFSGEFTSDTSAGLSEQVTGTWIKATWQRCDTKELIW